MITTEEIIDLPFQKKIKHIKFAVEATDVERHYLWKEFKQNNPKSFREDWVQDNHGLYKTLGNIQDIQGLTVSVQINFAVIMGSLVCFYYGTSKIVDWTMIENYIDEIVTLKYDNNSRKSRCDSNNFHQCLSRLEELKAKVSENV